MTKKIEEFKVQMKALLEGKAREELSEACEVSFGEFQKVGVTYAGILIHYPGCHISPIYPLEGYFSEWEAGRSVENIADSIIKDFKDRMDDVMIPHDFLDGIIKWEYVKNRVLYRLIAREGNEELLREIPNRFFLDTALIYYIDISYMTPESISCITINNSLMKKWRIDDEELHDTAYRNMMKEKAAVFMDMPSEIPIHVMTNEDCCFGATGLIYEGNREEAEALCGGSYYVLPVCVHEVLIVPENAGISKKELKSLHGKLSENNRIDDPSIFLSSRIYYYDAAEKTLEICCE